MISRLRNFTKDTLTWYQLISFIPFLVAMLVLIFVIGHLDRSIHLENLRKIVLLAALVGLAFSLIKKPRAYLLILISFASGLIVVITFTGRLFIRYMELLQTGSSVLVELIQAEFYEDLLPPDMSLLQDQWRSLLNSIIVLINRLLGWLLSLPDVTYDPVSVNLAWGIIVWLATIWAFWFMLKRNQALTGFLPPLGIIAASVPSIDSGLSWLGLILGIGLLLGVLGNHANQQEGWKEQYYTVSHRVWEIVAQYAFILSLGLVIFASVITSPILDDLIKDPREKWQEYRDRTSSDEDGSDAQQDAAAAVSHEVLEDVAHGWFPNEHLIGSGPDLAETEVFHALVEEPSSEIAPRYYFRSATYETYSNRGWQNIGKEIVLIPPEEEFRIMLSTNDNLVYQEVSLVQGVPNGNLMVAVGELTATDAAYLGSYHTRFVNYTYKDLFAAVTDSTSYRAYSTTPNYGEEDLRTATLLYPSWIKNKFLQVPDTTPGRVFELALSLTATQPTPYDRALAIERYLRGFEYTLDVDAPPRNRDAVDYFLFDLKKGYCDYYASAMVIMSRAAGIPARLATGYLASTNDDETGQFVVTADQSHSWAEIYFPDYGWVTFEPTAGQPAINRQVKRDEVPEDFVFVSAFDDQIGETEELQAVWVDIDFSLIALLFGGLLLAGLLVSDGITRWRLNRMDSDRMFAVLYTRLRRKAERLGLKATLSDTPLELAKELKQKISLVEKNGVFKPFLVSTAEAAEKVIQACSHAAYSSGSIGEDERKALIRLWGSLRWQLILAVILFQIGSIGRKSD